MKVNRKKNIPVVHIHTYIGLGLVFFNSGMKYDIVRSIQLMSRGIHNTGGNSQYSLPPNHLSP
jgi:hypothetical protein